MRCDAVRRGVVQCNKTRLPPRRLRREFESGSTATSAKMVEFLMMLSRLGRRRRVDSVRKEVLQCVSGGGSVESVQLEVIIRSKVRKWGGLQTQPATPPWPEMSEPGIARFGHASPRPRPREGPPVHVTAHMTAHASTCAFPEIRTQERGLLPTL